MKAAVFSEEVDRPGRIAFTMTRYDLLRLEWNSVRAAIMGDTGIAISTGDLEVLGPPVPVNKSK